MFEVHVFDTFAVSPTRRILHCNVLPGDKNSSRALACATDGLQSIGQPEATVKAESCSFCHSGRAPDEVKREIESRGDVILKMESCPV